MNKTSKQNTIEAVIQQITCQGESLEALKELSKLNSQIAALTKEAKNKREALLEGFGLETGDAADIVNGNGKLVASWKPQTRNKVELPPELKERYSKPFIVNMLKIH